MTSKRRPMNRERRLIFAIALVAVIISAPLAAHACRCLEPTVRQAYRRADLVVLATIDDVDRSGDVLKASATVDDAWKSSVPNKITLLSGESCAYEVAVGQKHLLFLYNGQGGIYGTIRCRGSRPATAAKKSLAWLKRYGKPGHVDLPNK